MKEKKFCLNPLTPNNSKSHSTLCQKKCILYIIFHYVRKVKLFQQLVFRTDRK